MVLTVSQVIKKFVVYSAALWGLPIGTFFVLQKGGAQVIAPYVGFPDLEDKHITTFAGVVAIVVVQLVIAAYIWSALNEPSPVPPKKRD